jgi:hypothetical protein
VTPHIAADRRVKAIQAMRGVVVAHLDAATPQLGLYGTQGEVRLLGHP